MGAELGKLRVKLVNESGDVWLNSHEDQFGGIVLWHSRVEIGAANVKGNNCALLSGGELGDDEDCADAQCIGGGCIGACAEVTILTRRALTLSLVRPEPSLVGATFCVTFIAGRIMDACCALEKEPTWRPVNTFFLRRFDSSSRVAGCARSGISFMARRAVM